MGDILRLIFRETEIERKASREVGIHGKRQTKRDRRK